MANYDDLNSKRIYTVAILSVVVTAVTALAVQVVYYALAKSQSEIKSAQSSYHRQNEVLESQTALISRYGVDPETGNITIPIDKAMELMIDKTSQEKPSKPDEQKSDADDA
jgi:flagellar basal body-associated protein FliL